MNRYHMDHFSVLSWWNLLLTGKLSWLTFQHFTLKFFLNFCVDAIVSPAFFCDRFSFFSFTPISVFVLLLLLSITLDSWILLCSLWQPISTALILQRTLSAFGHRKPVRLDPVVSWPMSPFFDRHLLSLTHVFLALCPLALSPPRTFLPGPLESDI